MTRRTVAFLLVAVCALALGTQPRSVTLAKGGLSGTVKLMPNRVPVGKNATLVGSRLPTSKYFYLILAVPDENRPVVHQLIQTLVKSDGNGNFKVHFRMPVVPVCGRASLYVSEAGNPASLRAAFTLTGCKASPPIKPPPAPPVKKKKH